MAPRRRWMVISLAALATGIAAYVGPEDKAAELAAPVVIERAHATPTAVRVSPLATELPARAPIGESRGDMFAMLSWAPPPPKDPPPQQQQQPAAPTPPPNPYRFAGTSLHDGQRKVYLLHGNHVVEAKEGEKLEQGFRVKSVTAEAVTLIYEQLGTPVSIALVFPDPAAPSAATGASAPATTTQAPAPGK